MNLFIAILTDLCHFIKIIMAMNLFGNFEERINKYKIILIATIIALASGIIYFDEKMKIGLLQHMQCLEYGMQKKESYCFYFLYGFHL